MSSHIMIIYRMLRLITAQDDNERRLDRILRKYLPQLPLSCLHRLLRKGKITLDGARALPGDRVMAGQIIEVPESEIPAYGIKKQKKDGLVKNLKEAAPLEILFHDSGFLVLNKPSGIAVHGPDSLEAQVLSYLIPLLPPSLSFKPGPLHRLDKGTSGIIVFSTSLNGAQTFSALLREGKIHKQYLAIVDGIIEGEKTWNDVLFRDKKQKKTFASWDIENFPEKGKKAQTGIKTLAIGRDHSLILTDIETGRTHQIRAQASIHGHPLTGDRKYGSKAPGNFLLHAWKMEAASLDLKFKAPLPGKFRQKILELFGEKALRKLQ